MAKQRIAVSFALWGAVILAAGWLLYLTPVFIIESNQGIYKILNAQEGKKFSLKFIHSVHLTPVVENFVITGHKTFDLESTEYQSLGVGMPFSRQDGVFLSEGGKFVMKDMDREFKSIELMIYPDNKLTLTCEGKSEFLFELPAGSLVKLKIDSCGNYFFHKYF
ncbi:MAG: DUF1850 domain-containing protein [Sporomusaceae bacterium]|jgi:hypothetical protein|nr:DUF1850 domain-containing protein [Sporomusaceae bacterium]